MVGGFGMSGTEPDHDTIMAIRQRWRACYDAIVERGIRTRDVLFGVVIEEWPASSLRPDDYGLLREGLNAIARAMR